MRRLQKSILSRYGKKLNSEDFAYAVDDTDNPKFGHLMHGVGYWHDSKGGYKGQKILVLVLIASSETLRSRFTTPSQLRK